ncbi:MAG: AraC family transcriptional regulator [Candidatus Izemoplasmatales bacterium]
MLEVVNAILDYIENHLFEEITLEDLSAYSHYSKFHLSREFNKMVGTSIPEYITRRRLSNAAIMIFETDKTISYIANTHGYNSDKYFSTVFKKNFGVSPSAYRNNPGMIYLYPKRMMKGGEQKTMRRLDDIVCEVNVSSKDDNEVRVTLSNIEVNGKDVTSSIELQDNGNVKVTFLE